MPLSGLADVTQDRVLTGAEPLTNEKVNEAATFTRRLKENSVTSRELAAAFSTEYFDTVADYVANTAAISDGTLVSITGYYTANASDAGPPYRVDTSDTTTVHDGLSCLVDANGLRAKRVLNEVDFKWGGAKGDGSTDDYAALNTCLAYARDNAVPLRPTKAVPW